MLATTTQRVGSRFTRRDLARSLIAGIALVGILSAILALDVRPSGPQLVVGDVAPSDVRSPRDAEYPSAIRTDEARAAARAKVGPVYDYTFQRGNLVAEQQANELRRLLAPVDSIMADATLDPSARDAALRAALPDLAGEAADTLVGLDASGWAVLRAELLRVLDAVERPELRDTVVAEARAGLAARFDPALSMAQRDLAAQILSPLVTPNSSYDATATEAERVRVEQAVPAQMVQVKQGETIVDAGHTIDALDLEKMRALGLLVPEPDVALTRIAGWVLLSLLLVGLTLAWLWRFRPQYWHRTNALLLLGLILLACGVGIEATGGRSLLPYVVPIPAAALLLAILLDAGTATVVAAVAAILIGVVNGSLDLAAFVLVASLAGAIAVRRGDRLSYFLWAALAMAVAGNAVVLVFALLGTRDVVGTLQLLGAGTLAAGVSAVTAVGLFAMLGNLFGITTVFQLLELASPTQPLLRRLLTESPGTYHHSLMVGNLGERAAEAVGADPLLTRVAAYYHDVGKLRDPLAFIENQAGGENVHDELEPEASADILKQHVPDGIDLAYEHHLPKALIAFIPQHHGTSLISFFYARAKELAAQAGHPDDVDQARFRHVGPKPQSREAAILMLADGVEASVRSLARRDEASIRAMVSTIIRERLEDGQFQESDLTLRDLDRIREAFVEQLLGMYHQRIEYPQNKIVELEARRASGAPWRRLRRG
jgi:putative nucleotidyltransferase with HDIG domain